MRLHRRLRQGRLRLVLRHLYMSDRTGGSVSPRARLHIPAVDLVFVRMPLIAPGLGLQMLKQKELVLVGPLTYLAHEVVTDLVPSLGPRCIPTHGAHPRGLCLWHLRRNHGVGRRSGSYAVAREGTGGGGGELRELRRRRRPPCKVRKGRRGAGSPCKSVVPRAQLRVQPIHLLGGGVPLVHSCFRLDVLEQCELLWKESVATQAFVSAAVSLAHCSPRSVPATLRGLSHLLHADVFCSGGRGGVCRLTGNECADVRSGG